MRSLFALLAVLAAGFMLVAYTATGTVGVAQHTESVDFEVDAFAVPELSAPAWGLYDTETETFLAGAQVHDVRPIASLVKLMTAYAALATYTRDEYIEVSARAVATEGRAGRLAAGQVLPAHEFIFPLLIESSNDAAEVLAEYDRDEFIAALQQQAVRLGMQDTAYADPSGLSPSNQSSVADTARLLHHLARTEPHLLDMTRLSRYVGTQHTWQNVNPLSGLRVFRGGKHGYTHAAGRTFAGIFELELADGTTRRMTIILLGSEDLSSDAAALIAFVREHVAQH